MHTLIAPFINLLILIALLVYYLRQPLKDFVHGRHLSIHGDIKKAQEQLRDAQARHEEFSAKLKAIDAEVSALHQQARQDAEATKARIIQEAKRLSDNIVSDAKSASQALVSELKDELYHELGSHVLSRAEKIISERLTSEDRARIRKDFSQHVGSMQ